MTKILADNDWNEHYIKRGDPKKPTYYIIRRMYKTTGLFGIYKLFASHIRYALYNGWLPVVDMQNYSNAYLPPEKLGKENSWEYYFEQPLRIGLEQAYAGENIILSNGDSTGGQPPNSKTPFLGNAQMSFFENKDGILIEWRMLVKLGLLKVKPELIKEISAVRKKLFTPTDRVLGVLLRGTDFLVRKLPNHPIPPPL